MRRTTRLLVSTIAVLGFVVASCGSDSNSAATTTAPTTQASPTVPAASGEVVVFAGSSLTEAFNEIATAFEVDNPEASVTFNFAGSSDLVTQITEGAPADIFVSADDSNMKKLSDAGEAVGEPVSIAKNTMQIMVEPGNPKAVAGVADLAEPGLIVVLCADTVPCGRSAATVLSNAAVTVTPASLEDKVKGVVTKVTAGEADAGIVYVTDVLAAGDNAAGVEIPADINVTNNYPMVLTKASPNPAAARIFVDFVASDVGHAILARYGFLAP
jgi:molybdate transport system substrate-binding protein